MERKLKVKPSFKENKRYLLIEIKAGKDEAKEEIKKCVKDFLGNFGFDKANPKFIEVDEKNNLVILAINRQELDNVRAALCLSKKQILVRRVSGTLKKLRS